MDGSGGGSAVTGIYPPPPLPKSPPKYPDLYGKRRQLAKVQVLEREIGFLEEELKSVQGIQLASGDCKEIVDFVAANSDPLILKSQKTRRSKRFWKWLCGFFCSSKSWICCCCHCWCSNCNLCKSGSSSNCSLCKCRCSKILDKPSRICKCRSLKCLLPDCSCCFHKCLSHKDCSSCRCTCCCCGHSETQLCKKNCCHTTCCFCC